jgi:hypothetical protein
MKTVVYFILFFIVVSIAYSFNAMAYKNTHEIKHILKNSENPVNIALEFINSYVKNIEKLNGSKGMYEWVKNNKLVSEKFKIELKKIIDQAKRKNPSMGLSFDPILNAQEYPEKGFVLESYDKTTNYIIVKGIDWPEFRVPIKMILIDNTWLVDGCGIVNIPKEKILE